MISYISTAKFRKPYELAARKGFSRRGNGKKAAHAAAGYARASGKVGVCLATSGPGATNLVTGIATAMMDSSPIVCITGQVPSEVIGSDAFQETDVTGVTLPVTKHNYLVQSIEELPQLLKNAFHIAQTGRPGPAGGQGAGGGGGRGGGAVASKA